MKAQEECVKNHTDWVDLWKLGKSAWDQVLAKIEFVLCIVQWYLSTAGLPKYILCVAEFISIIPVSPDVYI